ncbi:transporter, major facilitator family protein [Limosilactobacillus antri DSM 16041]|uniref:Transporter, major facilitator family protein n=2 Tax=Limosilactobacillus antri DSM 16041 TaxID=525309 RepID=C8P7H2_9LACO|nr:MFS transporter [Limosilactobacillus antri]EEW53590.1 transporter, major facilitator family protein [Limosilactobacillus antri DSM 16041]
MNNVDRHAVVKRWGTFALLYLGYMLLFADRTVMNISLAYVGRDFHVGAAALGATASAFFLGYTLMQIPGGYLTDRFGSKRLIIVSLLAWSVLTMVTGWAWSLAALVAIRFLFGIAEGPYPAAALKRISENYGKDEKSQATSALISSNYAGAAVAPLLIVPIIASAGWRNAFVWLGVIGLVVLVAYYLVERPIKQAATSGAQRPKIEWRNIDSRVWVFVVIGLALNIITKGLETWMPVYFLQARGINLKNLTWLVPLPVISGGIAALISGFVMVHWFKGRERWMISIASFLTLVFMFGLFKSSSLVAVVIFDVLIYFVKSLAFTGIFSFTAQILSEQTYGSSIGIVNFGGQLGGFIGPLLIGWLVQFAGSYSAAFLGLVISALVAAVACLFIRKK